MLRATWAAACDVCGATAELPRLNSRAAVRRRLTTAGWLLRAQAADHRDHCPACAVGAEKSISQKIQPIYAPPPPVTLVTALAASSDLPEEEYRRIYDRLAAGRSLRNIEMALHSGVSFAWWGKYAAGEKELDLDRKNELRAWANLPPLPPAVGAAVTAHAHPDAAVYRVGDAIASRIILVGADVASANLRINGACATLPENAPPTACNGRYIGLPPSTSTPNPIPPSARLAAPQTAKENHA